MWTGIQDQNIKILKYENTKITEKEVIVHNKKMSKYKISITLD